MSAKFSLPARLSNTERMECAFTNPIGWSKHDALRIVANGVNKLRTKDNAFVVITHYQRLLDYIVPDFVHVMYNGQIVKSGDKSLALELEEKGYDWVKELEIV